MKTTIGDEHMTGACLKPSNAIPTTGDPELTKDCLFNDNPSEIIERIGSFLRVPKDIAAFCQTCQRINAISMDKLRLYDPRIKISTSEVSYLLRKWKIPKFEITKETSLKHMTDKDIEGFYVDPNELLQWVKDDDSEGVYSVCESKNLFKRLLKADEFDPSVYDNYAIQCASENGHLEIVKLLLSDERVDPSDFDNDAIIMASYYGHLEIVKLLLADERVDPSDRDNYAIKWASEKGHLEVVKLLLAHPRLQLEQKDILEIRKTCSVDKDIINFLLNFESRARMMKDMHSKKHFNNKDN